MFITTQCRLWGWEADRAGSASRAVADFGISDFETWVLMWLLSRQYIQPLERTDVPAWRHPAGYVCMYVQYACTEGAATAKCLCRCACRQRVILNIGFCIADIEIQ